MLKNLIIILLICGVAVSCSAKKKDEAAMPSLVPVRVQAMEVSEVPHYLEATGKLFASATVSVAPEVSGTLEELCVTEGSFVKKGDPLFKMSKTSFEIKLFEAEAQLNADMATLVELEGKRERFNQLNNKELMSKVEWDELDAKLKRAVAIVEMDLLRKRAAELDLKSCTMTAPIDGWVGTIESSPGNYLLAHTAPLLTLSKTEPLSVEFTVTEKEAVALNDVTDLEVQPMVGNGTAVLGKILFIDHKVNPKTGQLLVKGELANENRRLFPGQAVFVKVLVSVETSAKLIPQKAVRFGEKGPYVFIVNDLQMVEVRPLRLGSEVETKVTVIEGLNSEDQVITEGHLRIFPGMKVEVLS